MSKVVAIIQARMGSTRLHGKVLMPICGKPMVQHVVDRAQAIKGIDHVVVAVPSEDRNQFGEHFTVIGSRYCNLFVYGGPGEDVLLRFYQATLTFKADIIMRLTGDCPLLAPEVCAEVLQPVLSGGVQFASNDTRWSLYPDGLDCECCTAGLLRRAHVMASDPRDREHVTRWMYEHATSKITIGTSGGPWPKLSVDTEDDLDRVRRIMARIPEGDYSWKATQEAIRESL